MFLQVRCSDVAGGSFGKKGPVKIGKFRTPKIDIEILRKTEIRPIICDIMTMLKLPRVPQPMPFT